MRLVRPFLVAFALCAAGCGGSGAPEPENLLLLSIDTLRADALGAYGSERGASPFLDRWAERGVRFARAWSHSPKTAPSHMTLLTGLPPRVHGVGNLKTAGSPSLGPEATTLAEVLAAEGYATAAFTDGGNVRGNLGFDRGFDLYVSKKAWDWEPRAAQVRDWLGRRDERPWFLFLHTYWIHDPYFPPPEVAARFCDPDYAGRILGDRAALEAAMRTEDLGARFEGHTRLLANYWGRVDADSEADLEHLRSLYLACLADLDAKLEALFAWLEDEGLLEETLVVVTSDHGEEFGEHGALRHDQLYAEHLHVPLLLRLPGDRHAGRVVESAVRHADLMASVLELLGIDVGFEHIGPSWAGWLDAPERAEDRLVHAEHRTRRERDLDLWALRRDGWLLYGDPEGTRLYDRGTDPGERTPVEAEGPRAELLDARRRELGRLQALSALYSSGAGTELTPEMRAELEALGYL